MVAGLVPVRVGRCQDIALIAWKENLRFSSHELSFPYKVSLQSGKARLRDGFSMCI